MIIVNSITRFDRYCQVCDKHMKIYKKIYCNSAITHKSKYLSKEGINFNRKWFCYECWQQILNYKKNDSDIKFK